MAAENEADKSEEDIPNKTITPEEFFLESSLYEKVLLVEENDNETYADLLSFNSDSSAYSFRATIKSPGGLTLDSYCPNCKNQSVFQNHAEALNYSKINQNGLHTTVFICSRNKSHFLVFHFYFDGECVQKIGQLPSLADLQKAEIGEYRKILGDKYQEFSKAVGLAAHGVGIGSFVYLRRIFESLVEEAHQKGTTEKDWKEEDYTDRRMDEKIVLLKNYLPNFLVENRRMYSILSKGIHELGEDECIKFFPVIKAGIEIILDEKLRLKEADEKAQKAKNAIAGIHSKMT
jgi:hypothetical protein